jgi:hypothetical protein
MVDAPEGLQMPFMMKVSSLRAHRIRTARNITYSVTPNAELIGVIP